MAFFWVTFTPSKSFIGGQFAILVCGYHQGDPGDLKCNLKKGYIMCIIWREVGRGGGRTKCPQIGGLYKVGQTVIVTPPPVETTR